MLSVTLAEQDTPSTVPYSGSSGATTVSGYPVADDVTAYFGNMAYSHTFSPSLLDQARLTAQRNNNCQNFPIGTQPGPSQLGINITPDLVDGPTNINLEGRGMFAGYNPFGPANIVDNTFTFTNDLSWTQGQALAQVRFLLLGLSRRDDLRLLPERRVRFLRPRHGDRFGQRPRRFPDGPAGRLPGVSQRAHQHPVALLRRLRAGLLEGDAHASRWTSGCATNTTSPSTTPIAGRSRFIPGHAIDGFPGRAAGPAVSRRQGRAHTARISRTRGTWRRALGFAWDVFGNAKTSIRGGVGMFYDVLKAEDNLQFNGQAPFFASGYLGFCAPDGGFTSDPGILSNPFAAAGAVNPFPSKPVNHNVNFARRGLPAHRRRQSLLRRSAPEDAVHLPVQLQRAAAVGQQPDALGGLRRLPGARADRADRHQPVRARQRYPSRSWT